MSIGKSAIKRVENNGYSKVKSEAPDMENSTVAESAKPAPRKRTTAPKMEKKEPRESGVRKHNNAEKVSAKAETPKVETEEKPASKRTVRDASPKTAPKAEPKAEAVETVEAEAPKAEETPKSATEYYNICRGNMPVHLL